MTISTSDNTPRISYSVSEGASQSSFAVPFEFFADADLNVYLDGTLKTISTHYSVSGGSGTTGSISMSVTGASGGSTVIITRGIALDRTTDFPTSGSFAIGTLNTELDRFVAIQADLNDTITRSVRLQDEDTAVSMELPLKADRVGKILGFNSSTGAAEGFEYLTASTLTAVAVENQTAGTVAASKFVLVDANKDIASFRNITLTGELDAGSLDISGDADIDGTLEADAITIGGVTLAETIADTVGAMVSSNTESGIAVTYDDSDNTLDFTVASLTTVGALDSGSITSGFGAIDNGSSAITTTGTITAGTFVLGTASLNENDLESIDGITAGTAAASKALILDANLDNSGARNITISGELDAATLDISGNADIDGTLEADAITLGGTALGSLYSPIAGSSSIVTTGALNSGSITSGFGTIDTGSSTITTTGEVGVGRLNLSSAVSSGDLGSDKAQVGYHSADGLLLMGQGTTNDVSLINDTGTVVARIPTGGSTFVVSGALQSTGATGAKLFLTTAEATVVADDSLGAIEFYATSETSPDGNSKAGAIECTAEGTFAGDNNATQMLFKLGVSEAASTKMTLSSGGNLTVTGVGTFASLDISGDIDIDGTSNLDIIDVDGAANFAADVTFADGADIITASAGTSNVRVGVNAGNSIQSGGNYNVVVGDEAGTALTTGDGNVAIGFNALANEDAHGLNVAVGNSAL